MRVFRGLRGLYCTAQSLQLAVAMERLMGRGGVTSPGLCKAAVEDYPVFFHTIKLYFPHPRLLLIKVHHSFGFSFFRCWISFNFHDSFSLHFKKNPPPFQCLTPSVGTFLSFSDVIFICLIVIYISHVFLLFKGIQTSRVVCMVELNNWVNLHSGVNWGTVPQWLALLPQSKKARGSVPGPFWVEFALSVPVCTPNHAKASFLSCPFSVPAFHFIYPWLIIGGLSSEICGHWSEVGAEP